MQLNNFRVLSLFLPLLTPYTTYSLPPRDLDNTTVQTAGEFRPENIASDAWWDRYRNKGQQYQCLFAAGDKEAGRLVGDTRVPASAGSAWKGSMYAARHTWNWHENYFDEDNCNFEYLHLDGAFKALGLNAYCHDDPEHKGLNVGWSLGHYDESRVDDSDPDGWHHNMLPPLEQTYLVEGKTYKSTGGYYTFTVNPHDGSIFTLDIQSPRNAVATHWRSIGGLTNPADLPQLQYASDLIWGKWVEENPDASKLRVYGVHNVLNDETSALVARALREKGANGLEVWPGAVFEKDQDGEAFRALIGSPIGGTISILLFQHKAELGNKEIYKVNVISDRNSLRPFQVTELHMFFHVRDVPQPTTEE